MDYSENNLRERQVAALEELVIIMREILITMQQRKG